MPLAVTDANLLLGRLVVDYFPKIFGKSEKEPLDYEVSKAHFEQLAKDINDSHSFENKLSLDEVVYGYAFFHVSCFVFPRAGCSSHVLNTF